MIERHSELPDDLSRARILLSNDDGVNAPGLKILSRIAKELSKDVWISAPEAEQSGAGHSLTLRRPLRLHKAGSKRYYVDGTPTDSVLLGLRKVLRDKPPQLVLTGVNRGANLGEDVTYSGTIAAAMEATLLGIPAIAMSQCFRPGQDVPWETAVTHAPALIRRIVAAGWPRNVVININFPACAPDQVAGVTVARQGQRQLGDQLGERVDMRGEHYYWIGPLYDGGVVIPGNDLHAVSQNRIAVTPLHLDLTHDPTSTALAHALG